MSTPGARPALAVWASTGSLDRAAKWLWRKPRRGWLLAWWRAAQRCGAAAWPCISSAGARRGGGCRRANPSLGASARWQGRRAGDQRNPAASRRPGNAEHCGGRRRRRAPVGQGSIFECGAAAQRIEAPASGPRPFCRHHGGGVPEYWGRDSPYHPGTDFLGTPANHLDVRATLPAMLLAVPPTQMPCSPWLPCMQSCCLCWHARHKSAGVPRTPEDSTDSCCAHLLLQLVAKRPVSPHVFEITGVQPHYKFPLGAISSITNRATGCMLSVGACMALFCCTVQHNGVWLAAALLTSCFCWAWLPHAVLASSVRQCAATHLCYCRLDFLACRHLGSSLHRAYWRPGCRNQRLQGGCTPAGLPRQGGRGVPTGAPRPMHACAATGVAGCFLPAVAAQGLLQRVVSFVC